MNTMFQRLTGSRLALAVGAFAAAATGTMAWSAGGQNASAEVARATEPTVVVAHELKSMAGSNSVSPATFATADTIPTYPQTMVVGTIQPGGEILRCQYVGESGACAPACGGVFSGVDCSDGRCRIHGQGEAHWKAWRPIPWQSLAQGEYIGPARIEHVPEYRLRVDDVLEFVFRLTREESSKPYELQVGDRIRLESVTNADLAREVAIQPDGTIAVPLVGQIRAARRTIEELQKDLEDRTKKFEKIPAITVTPISVNTRLEDLRATVDSRAGAGGQFRTARITPEGTIQLPAIGSVAAQGLSLSELKTELEERYAQVVDGIEVTPVLTTRAPRYVYVLGEVRAPGRFTLEGPTTVMQSVALAGGWEHTGNLREIVVFRRTEDWRLVATRLDLKGAMLGKRPCPADEIWLRDSDLVIIPKSPIAQADDFINLVFTNGIYGVVPFQGITVNMAKLSTI